MPQIQILEGAPGFGSQLGKVLGQGVSQGIQQGISARLNNMLQAKKEMGKVRSSLGSLSRRYEKGTFSPEALNAFEERANELVQQGVSADDATMAAIQEYSQRQAQESAQQPPEEGFFKKHFGVGRKVNQTNRQAAMNALKNVGEDVKGAAAKFGYPFVGLGSFAAQGLQELGRGGRYALAKAAGLSDEEIQAREQELGRGTRAGEEATGIINPLAAGGTSLLEAYQRATGGRGPGENPIERTIQGALIGGLPGAAANVAGEATHALGLPEPVQAAVDALAFITTLKAQPKIKLPSFKANKRVLSKAEEVAAKTGQKVEEVLQKAQQESGADFQKALAGDAQEINKLNRSVTKEAPKISEKVSETPKQFFNKKQALREREVFGAKLAEHPFEEYYAVEGRKAAKEAAKTPPTLAKEAEITARLEPLQEAKYSEWQQQKSDLRKLEKDAKGLEGANKARVEALTSFKRKEVEKTLEELKDLQYELKYFRKRPTEAEIAHEASKKAEQLVHEIKNPTPAGQKKIREEIKADQKVLDAAEATMKRGELPGEIRPDTYIKINEKYLEAYNTKIAELKEANKALRGRKDAEALKEFSENKIALEHLEHRQKVLKGKITNQRDKMKAMRGIEGPAGAFYRNQLKSTQNTVSEFQKDFFKEPKVKSEVQQKTQKIAQREIKKAEELGQKVVNNPTSENINEAAELLGEKPQEVREDIDKFKSKIKEKAEKVEAGKTTEKDIQQTQKETKNVWDIKGNIRAAGRHVLVGSTVAILENEFNIKIPRRYLYPAAGLAGYWRRSPGRVLGFSAGHDLVNFIYNEVESKKLRSLRKNPNEYTMYVSSLRKRYGPKRVKNMIDGSK